MVPTLAHASAPSNGCCSRRPEQHDCGRCVTKVNDCNHFLSASQYGYGFQACFNKFGAIIVTQILVTFMTRDFIPFFYMMQGTTC
jgi:hypothetical protein